jgi:hypothetical protein
MPFPGKNEGFRAINIAERSRGECRRNLWAYRDPADRRLQFAGAHSMG